MKKALSILFASILLNSCGVISTLPTFSTNSSKVGTERESDFIELNDGKIIEGKMENIDFYGFKNYPILGKKFAINGTNYKYNDISAIQYKNKYFRKYKKELTELIIRGKINVYTNTNTTGPSEKGRVSVYNLYFLQKGEKAILEYFENKVMDKYIADNSEAVTKFEQYKKMSNREKNKGGGVFLTEIIEIYNK